ncbi:2-oxoacid:acceptor oxidoreductase subunit alpha [Magnetovibrio sp.]|uniref:2-oxoacid:acceptor oxidoreductase subunit alpha n=1 Tax=Magnetovibrio sp. TaxID=2024836 RepID=UPI002F95B074
MTGSAIDNSRVSPVRQTLDSAVVRFSGDSGDGMQITGGQFTLATAVAQNNLSTFPDYPAEIRAPTGTTFGVSAFQINFGSRVIKTAGDEFDVLVAMNPAALKVELPGLKVGGILIVDSGSFQERNLHRAGYGADPLKDGSLEAYRVIEMDISTLTQDAVSAFGLSKKEALRCKNFWTLGYVYWMFDRDRQATIDWLKRKFASRPDIADANIAALNAGHALAETMETADGLQSYTVPHAPDIEPGLYRTVTGAEAMAWGLAVGSKLAALRLVFCSYPITPASPVLHTLSKMIEHDIVTFQAEDEIAAVCAAIGASYAGGLGVTSSSGPGISLKAEAIGLAVSSERPLVVINTQRAGPSTGLPTKTEQSDLLQALYGRNGECPLVVIAARSPSDCFEMAIEACHIATKYQTPVMVLSDGYISNASEPWLIPDVDAMEPFPTDLHQDGPCFDPSIRDAETLARPWAIPGTPCLEHRIGGLEKSFETGNISYDPANHQKMTDVRAAKVAGVVRDIPDQGVEAGPESGPVAVVGWGSTYGPINRAVSNLIDEGLSVSHIHVRNLWPLPANLGALLAGFDQVLVPEMNSGQFVKVLRDQYLIDAKGINKVMGQPFKIHELEDAIRAYWEAAQ